MVYIIGEWLLPTGRLSFCLVGSFKFLINIFSLYIKIYKFDVISKIDIRFIFLLFL